MAMTQCPECSHPVSDTAVECPKCGAVIAELTDEKSKIQSMIPIAMFLSGVVMLVFSFDSSDPEENISAVSMIGMMLIFVGLPWWLIIKIRNWIRWRKNPTTKCPECSHPAPSAVRVCPECGAVTSKLVSEKLNNQNMSSIIMFWLGVVMFAYSSEVDDSTVGGLSGLLMLAGFLWWVIIKARIHWLRR